MAADDFLLIRKQMAREDLSRAEARAVVRSLLETDAQGYELLAFSVASQTKGETAEEMLGYLDAIAALTGPYAVDVPGALTDIASAGASGLRKLNVSTLSALVVGEPGFPVAKQSFFRVTGMIGSADVAQAVGLTVPRATLPQIERALREIERALREVGVAFYSPLFVSPELRNLVGFGMMLAERKVGVPTPFHMLAPIFTPLKLRYRMFGLNRLNSFDLLVELFRGLG